MRRTSRPARVKTIRRWTLAIVAVGGQRAMEHGRIRKDRPDGGGIGRRQIDAAGLAAVERGEEEAEALRLGRVAREPQDSQRQRKQAQRSEICAQASPFSA